MIPIGGGYYIETGSVWEFIGGLLLGAFGLWILWCILYSIALHMRRSGESVSYQDYYDKLSRSETAREVARARRQIFIREAKAVMRGKTAEQEEAYQKLIERAREEVELDVYYQYLKDKLDF